MELGLLESKLSKGAMGTESGYSRKPHTGRLGISYQGEKAGA